MARNRHLLVTRLSAMGDVAMTAPVLRALRKSHPELKITLLTRPMFQPFFRNVEQIEFFTPDLKGRHKGLIGLWRLYRDVSALNITDVADLHEVLRTRFLRRMLAFSGARVAVVDKGRADKRALTRKFRKFFKPLKTTIERYCEVFGQLGLGAITPTPPPRNPLSLSPQIEAVSGVKSGRWIGVAPFAQHKGKIYPTVQSDQLIGLLSEQYERVFIFGGGPYERDFAECMQMRHTRVTSLIGQLTLDQELDLISNLDCLVSMDSSAMHMASLVGTPVVSIWGATHPYAGFYGFGQDPKNAVQLDLPCRPCSVYGNKPCLYKDYRCLSGISPETIAERIKRVVEG